MNMSPRWGFPWFGVGGYNDVAPSKLNNGSLPAPIAAIIQQQWGQGEIGPVSQCTDTAKPQP